MVMLVSKTTESHLQAPLLAHATLPHYSVIMLRSVQALLLEWLQQLPHANGRILEEIETKKQTLLGSKQSIADALLSVSAMSIKLDEHLQKHGGGSNEDDRIQDHDAVLIDAFLETLGAPDAIV